MTKNIPKIIKNIDTVAIIALSSEIKEKENIINAKKFALLVNN